MSRLESAPPNLRNDGRCSHAVQFYSDDSALVEALGQYFVPVLEGGGSALIVGTLDHRLALARNLETSGIDVPNLTDQGRYVAEDATGDLVECMLDGRPDASRFSSHFEPLLERTRTASQSPHSSVFVFGEMVALLWAEREFEAALQLERLWNDLLQRYPFHLRCAYPVGLLGAPEPETAFLKMCAEHSQLLPVDAPVDRASAHEVTERMWAERALLDAHEELETRVGERTAQLRQEIDHVSRQAEELHRTNWGLRELSSRLLRAQDDERRRVARDLHDETAQALALLSMILSSLQSQAEPRNPALAAELNECSAIVRQVCGQVRALSYLLHPPLLDEMGLDSALRWYVDGFERGSDIRVRLELPEDLGRLGASLEIAIFRVVQECLANVHRHSGSRTAGIRLERSGGTIVLNVTDSGRGIPDQKPSQISSVGTQGVGLLGIQERIKDFGGNLEVTSSGKGTQIRVVIPAATVPCEEEPPKAAG